MNTHASRIIALTIILFSFLIGIYLYPVMPLRMASHWNINGDVDGYISRSWGLFLMPAISFIIFVFFEFFPKIDPLKKNIEGFRKHYNGFVIAIMAFLFYLYLLTIFWNIGVTFDMVRLLIPALAIIFYYAGVVIENAKMNWFIGIRTPWTLTSEHVWQKTHRLGGKLFKLAGLISLVGLLVPAYAFYLAIIPILAVTAYTFGYSYFEFKKESKK